MPPLYYHSIYDLGIKYSLLQAKLTNQFSIRQGLQGQNPSLYDFGHCWPPEQMNQIFSWTCNTPHLLLVHLLPVMRNDPSQSGPPATTGYLATVLTLQDYSSTRALNPGINSCHLALCMISCRCRISPICHCRLRP